ncbi:hypothetical protein BH10BAC4_BH10BAC4_05770 [soil metagenome]
MSLLKYIDRVKRMDHLIRLKATGSPEEFAQRLGLGKTVLMEELKELKELGAKISYCKVRRSYLYDQEFVFKIGNLDDFKKNEIRGGMYFQDTWRDGGFGLFFLKEDFR